MFYGAGSFNQPLDDWDVRNVNDMQQMFVRAKSFAQSLDRWDNPRVPTAFVDGSCEETEQTDEPQ